MTADTHARARSATDQILSIATLTSAVLVGAAAVIYLLIRTIGIGPLQFPGETRGTTLIAEFVTLAATASLVALSTRPTSVRARGLLALAAAGVLSVQAVAFGFDPNSVLLQLATLGTAGIGVVQLIRDGRLSNVVFGTLAGVLAIAVGTVIVWLITVR
jgi:hypothetical protein